MAQVRATQRRPSADALCSGLAEQSIAVVTIGSGLRRLVFLGSATKVLPSILRAAEKEPTLARKAIGNLKG